MYWFENYGTQTNICFYYFKMLFSNLSDEEEQQLQPLTLTRQHKGAIRAIRKVI